MKVLAEFFVDCGRMGELHGLFVAESESIADAFGREAYFDEVLGKHSEIEVELNSDNIAVLGASDAFIEEFQRLLPDGVGICPLSYLRGPEGDE